jgi:WD40 repeat protein
MTQLTATGLIVLLAGNAVCGEGARPPRTDRYGDPLPPRAVARLGTARLRHGGADVTFSTDGKRLISFGWDGEVRVWDTASGKLVQKKRLARSLSGRALAPGGATAAAWALSKLRVYDTATGKERRRLPAAHDCSLLTFSRDGKFLAGAATMDCRFYVWDIAQGKTRRVFKGPDIGVAEGVALSPDGKLLAATIKREDELPDGYGKVWLWDTTTGREIGEKFQKKAVRVTGESLTFSSDGKILAVGGYHGKVHFLATVTLKQKAGLKGASCNRLAFAPASRFLAGAYEVRGETWPLHPRIEYSGVLLWDLKGTKKPRRLPGAGVSAQLAFSPDGKTLACQCNGFGSEIRLWDVASGRPLLHRPGHGTSVEALAVSPDGKLVASNAADALYLWKAATGEALHELGGRDDFSHVCLFSPDSNRLISAGSKGVLQVWDVATGKELRRFQIYPAYRLVVQVHAAGISADGKRLAAVLSVGSTSGELLVWDLATGKRLKERPYKLEVRTKKRSERHGPRGIAHAAFAPDGEVVTVWQGTKVGLEEVATGRLLAELPAGVGNPMVFSPDGRLVAAALLRPKPDPYQGDDRKGVSLIETATGEEVVRLETGDVDCLAFTPDGRGLVVADGESLRVWDADTGERLYQRAWPEGVRDVRWSRRILDVRRVRSLAVLPGGRAVTGLEEGDVLVWDLAPASWPAGKPVRDLGRRKLDALWSDLAGKARKAQRAVKTLAAAPEQAVPFLGGRLKPAAVDVKRVRKLLADLDHERLATREAATRELADLRDRIEPLLRRRLQGKPSPIARLRLRTILAGPALLPAETRRTVRAIAVLERIGTPAARRLLEKLVSGADARPTRAAKAALRRLSPSPRSLR